MRPFLMLQTADLLKNILNLFNKKTKNPPGEGVPGGNKEEYKINFTPICYLTHINKQSIPQIAILFSKMIESCQQKLFSFIHLIYLYH